VLTVNSNKLTVLFIFRSILEIVHMAQIPENIMSVSKQFVEKIKSEIPVTKAILFGSFVNGNYDEGSDVGLAIFF
jgi:predicted nucleotidyltransferase